MVNNQTTMEAFTERMLAAEAINAAFILTQSTEPTQQEWEVAWTAAGNIGAIPEDKILIWHDGDHFRGEYAKIPDWYTRLGHYGGNSVVSSLWWGGSRIFCYNVTTNGVYELDLDGRQRLIIYQSALPHPSATVYKSYPVTGGHKISYVWTNTRYLYSTVTGTSVSFALPASLSIIGETETEVYGTVGTILYKVTASGNTTLLDLSVSYPATTFLTDLRTVVDGHIYVRISTGLVLKVNTTTHTVTPLHTISTTYSVYSPHESQADVYYINTTAEGLRTYDAAAGLIVDTPLIDEWRRVSRQARQKYALANNASGSSVGWLDRAFGATVVADTPYVAFTRFIFNDDKTMALARGGAGIFDPFVLSTELKATKHTGRIWRVSAASQVYPDWRKLTSVSLVGQTATALNFDLGSYDLMDYESLALMVNVRPSVNEVPIFLRFNYDATAANYATIRHNAGSTLLEYLLGAQPGIAFIQAADYTGSMASTFWIYILDFRSAHTKSCFISGYDLNVALGETTASNHRPVTAGGSWISNAPITSLSIVPNSGVLRPYTQTALYALRTKGRTGRDYAYLGSMA